MSRRFGVGAGLAVLVLDQLTKAIARSELAGGRVEELPLGFDLRLFSNDGIAFSLFEGGGSAIAIISVVVFGALVAYLVTADESPIPWFAVGLLAGGALGNLVDRIRVGAVTDFIDPASWPAFNVADIAITVGMILILVDQLLPLRGSSTEGQP